MNDITILTPTFNRADTIEKLYNSLLNQTQSDFQWVVVDDGSTDDTKKLISEYIENNLINIKYIYQENGGKARALNRAFRSIDTKVFVVVDSDDYLKNEAIEIIKKYLTYTESNNEIGGFFFHYEEHNVGKIHSRKELNKDRVLNCFEYFEEYGKHDGCLCYLNKVVKKYQYPEYTGEKYIGPTVLQMKMSDEFKILYSPVVIGIAAYQPNGLTNSGRYLRVNNPLGMRYYNFLKQKRTKNRLEKLKTSIFIWSYAKIGKTKESFIDQLKTNNHYLYMFLSYIPGLLLSKYWVLKYRGK